MSQNVADALLAETLLTPWCMTEAGLSTVISVLTRTNISPEALERDRGTPLTNDGNADVTIRDGVAIIEAAGPMVRRGDFFSRVSSATSYDRVARDLGYAIDATAARAVLISIDSPGGTVTGVSDLAAMIRAGTQKKPIVIHTDGDLSSGAYWLASAASEIVASPTATVGSIGVVLAMRKERTSSADRMAVFEFVSSQSPKKRVDPETDAGRAQLLATADALAQVFVEEVARYRGVTPATVLARFGQGGVLVGQSALDAGMIDRLGTFEETLARLSGRSAAVPVARTVRAPAGPSRAMNDAAPATETSRAHADTSNDDARGNNRNRLLAGARRAGVLRDAVPTTPSTAMAPPAKPRVMPSLVTAHPTATPAPSQAERQARRERLLAGLSRAGVVREPVSTTPTTAIAPPAKPRVMPSPPPTATPAPSQAERQARRERLLAGLSRAGVLRDETT